MTPTIGQRVCYIAHNPKGLHNQVGTVTALNRYFTATVKFDNDGNRLRIVAYSDIAAEEKTMQNFKTQVKDALYPIVDDQGTLTAEDNAARRLGLGYELARVAEELKKKAKGQLTKLGLIHAFTPGVDETIVDSSMFVVVAKTSEPAKRLNEAALRAALDAEKLSAPAKARIMAAAFVEASPATTYRVEQR